METYAAGMPLRERRLWIPAFALFCLMPLLLATMRAGADIGFCIIGALFLANSFRERRWEWTRHPEIRALGMFWCYMLLMAWLTPVSPLKSFGLAFIWVRFIVFFAAARYWLLQNPATAKPLNAIGLITLLLVAIYALCQYVIGPEYQRLTIPFSHNPNVAHFLLKVGLPMLGLAAWHILESGKWRLLWIPISGLFILVALVPLTGERSAALLMLLSLGILGLLLFFRLPQARKLIIFAGAGIIVLLETLAATQPMVQERMLYFLEQISDFWHTEYGQLYIGAWRLWQQHPITGIGVQQFHSACNTDLLGTTYCDVHPHNMYLQWLVETGVPGFVLIIAAVLLMLRGLMREAVLKGNKTVPAAFAYAGFAVLTFPIIVTQNPFSNWPAMVHWYSLALVLSMFTLTGRDAR